jgi:hypothetical protein
VADLGLTLVEAMRLLTCVRQAVVAAQTEEHGRHRPDCLSCRGGCQVKDRRSRHVATLFGEAVARIPRFTCAVCKRIVTGIDWPQHTPSMPELQQLQAHLSAMMAYRVVLPVTAGTSPQTLRGYTLPTAETLDSAEIAAPTAVAAGVTVSLNSTFIRGREDGERHLEVRVGNVETAYRNRPGGESWHGRLGTGVSKPSNRRRPSIAR